MRRQFAIGILSLIALSGSAQWPIAKEYSYSEKDGLPPGYVYHLTFDNEGYLWVGHENGLFRFDGYEFRSFKLHETGLPIDVTYVQPEGDSVLWLGTNGHGLKRLSMLTSEVETFMYDPTDSTSISYNRIWTLLPSDQDHLWVGHETGGLTRFNKITKKSERFYPDFAVGDPLREWRLSGMRSIVRDPLRPGRLWLALLGGLGSFDTVSQEFEYYPNPYESNLRWNSTRSLHVADDGSIWHGIYYGGVRRYEPETGSWQEFRYMHYPPNDPPNFNIALKLSPKSDDELWVTTGYFGTGVLNKNTGEFTFRSPISDGQTVGSELHQTHVMDKYGIIWVGGQGGDSQIRVLFPEDVSVNDSDVWLRPVVSSVAFKTDSSIVVVSPKQTMRLPGYTDVVTINLTGNHLIEPQKQEYRYRLNGRGWHETGNDRKVLLTGLKGGAHTFEAQVRLKDQPWSDHGVELKLTIPIPFWQTLWFKLTVILAGLLVIAVVVVLTRWSTKRRARRRLDFEKRLARLRLNSIKEQINPHFLFNTLNTIKSHIILNDRDKASDYLTQFSELFRSVINQAEQGKLITLREKLRTVELFMTLQKARLNDDLSYALETDNKTDLDNTWVPPLFLLQELESVIDKLIEADAANEGLAVSFSVDQSLLNVEISYKLNGASTSLPKLSEDDSNQLKQFEVLYGIKIGSKEKRVTSGDQAYIHKTISVPIGLSKPE